MASLRDEIGDFVGIPISFMEDTKQTAESRVVFMVLRYHTNKKSKRAFPGYETIMAESGLSRQKTAEGIKVLVNTGWLVKHKQFAKVTEYELRYPARAVSSTGELRQDAAIVPPENVVSSAGEQPPITPEQDRSNKIKEDQPKPRRKEIQIEPPFHGDEFLTVFGEFELYCRQKRKAVTGVARTKLFQKLAKYPERVVVEALNESMANRWTGVFPEKIHPNGRNGNNGNGSAPKPSPEERAHKQAELRERMTGARTS